MGEWANGRTGERAIRGLNRVVRRDRADVAGLNRRFAHSPARPFAHSPFRCLPPGSFSHGAVS
jgi:hypothetical protein